MPREPSNVRFPVQFQSAPTLADGNHSSAVQFDVGDSHGTSTKHTEPSLNIAPALRASQEPPVDENVQTGLMSRVHQINDEELPSGGDVQTGSITQLPRINKGEPQSGRLAG